MLLLLLLLVPDWLNHSIHIGKPIKGADRERIPFHKAGPSWAFIH